MSHSLYLEKDMKAKAFSFLDNFVLDYSPSSLTHLT